MTQMGSYAMTHNSERFREGANAFRNLRELAKRHRDKLIDQANRHAPTESLSTSFTNSRISLSGFHESEPDTSADELAIKETTIKRIKRMPRA
jgi:hypothetical protein